jgi:hypothetical protein
MSIDKFARERDLLVKLRDASCGPMVRDWSKVDSLTHIADIQGVQGLEVDVLSKNLVGLDLSGEEGVGDISALAKLKYLTKINLAGCWRVDNGTYDIVYNDTERETVEAEMIRPLSGGKLETNDVVEVNYKNKGEYFSGVIARQRLGGLTPISNCLELEYLDLTGTAISNLTKLIAVPLGNEPVSHLPKLTTLKVGRTKLALGMIACLGRTDWLEVISKAWAHSLQALDIQYTSVALLNDLHRLRSLSSLCLAGCNSLKLDTTNLKVFEGLVRLKVLDLSSVKIVDNQALELLGEATAAAVATVKVSAAAAAIARVATIAAFTACGSAEAAIRHTAIRNTSADPQSLKAAAASATAVVMGMAATEAATVAHGAAAIAACAPGLTNLNLSHCEKVRYY